MIYKGNQKEGKIYKGGTKIGKIYKGGTLVYQSQKSLRLYGYTNSSSPSIPCGMIGGFTTAFPYYNATSNGTYVGTITAINGVLGQSGSSISYTGSTTTPSYHSSHWVNGVLLHFYFYYGTTHRSIWVIDGSIVGSTIIFCHYNNTDYTLGYPTSANSSTIQFPFYNSIATANRDSSLDKTWTINGVY